MDALQVIHARKSCRSFKPDPIPQEKLEAILKAGQAAPMGMKQPVHLAVVENPALLREIDAATAKALGKPELSPLYGASVLVIACYQKDVAQALGVANTANAVENMLLAATALGVGSIFLWSATFAFPGNPDLAGRCGIPEGYIPVSSAGLGLTDEDVQGASSPKCEITISRR